MNSFFCTFSTVEELITFVRQAEQCDFDVDVRYQHILLDGKSLMGVMNIGIGKSVEVICHSEYALAAQLLVKKTFLTAVQA